MKAWTALIALAVVGCATAPTENTAPSPSAAAAFPENYRTVIIEQVRKTFVDPYSIRDASISAPIPPSSGFWASAADMTIVCVRANAKNRMGAYGGLTVWGVYFRPGHPVLM